MQTLPILLPALQTAENSCEVCQRTKVGGSRAESTNAGTACHTGTVCKMWVQSSLLLAEANQICRLGCYSFLHMFRMQAQMELKLIQFYLLLVIQKNRIPKLQ